MKKHSGRALALVVVAISLIASVPAVGMAVDANVEPVDGSAAVTSSIKLVGFNDKSTTIETALASLPARSEMISPDMLGSVKIGTDVVFINVAGLSESTSVTSVIADGPNQTVITTIEDDLSKSLRELILQGIPVLIISDGPDLFKAALAGLEMPMVFQDDSTIYGYKYDPVLDVAAGFCVGRPNPTIQPDEVQAACSWGLKRLDGLAGDVPSYDAARSMGAALLTTPTWQFDYTLSSYNNLGSYGQLNVNTNYYVLMNDGDPTYNYYTVNYGLQNVPGPGGLGQWYNADMWVNTGNINDRGDIYPTRWLLNYQPVGTLSGGTVTVSFTQYGAPISWSYPIDSVTVHDQSNYATATAGWWHDVNELASIGRQSYTIHPGTLVRTEQAWGGYYQVMHDTYRIQWYQAYLWPFGGWHSHQVTLSGQIPAPTS